MDSYAYYNGSFGRRNEIFVPLTDRSIFFGDAVYDAAIGCYDRIMWEEEHIARLLISARRVGIDHPYTPKFLSSLMREIAIRSMIKSYFIYIQISRGKFKRSHSATNTEANLLITVDHIKIEDSISQMTLASAVDIRHGMCDVKTVNLLPAVMASSKADDMSADEALFIKNGIVTECAKSNISMLKQGRIITHPLNSSILAGVTRSHFLSACADMGLEICQEEFPYCQLFEADEIFVTSCSKLCKTVSHIDSIPVGGRCPDSSHEIFKRLYNDYLAICKP